MFAEAMAALYIYYLENAVLHGQMTTLDRDGIRECSPKSQDCACAYEKYGHALSHVS